MSNFNDSIEVNSDSKLAQTLNIRKDGKLELFKQNNEKVITRINSTTPEHFDVELCTIPATAKMQKSVTRGSLLAKTKDFGC